MNWSFCAAACAFSLPLAAHAERVDFLKVWYAGTVSSLHGDVDGYAEGQRVTGTLRIDLRYAPPDLDPDPSFGWYTNNPYYTANGDSRFVSGYAGSAGVRSYDVVQVVNNPKTSSLGDALYVIDSERRQMGAAAASTALTRTTDWLYVYGESGPYTSIIRDGALAQQVDLRGDRVGGAQIGVTHERFNGEEWVDTLESYAKVTLSRFTVTPGRCTQ